MGISSHRDTKGSCKTKIGQLQVVTFIDKEILRLEVPMKDAMRMAVKQPRCELVSESLQKKDRTHVKSWIKRHRKKEIDKDWTRLRNRGSIHAQN